jgi:hypothetical protein
MSSTDLTLLYKQATDPDSDQKSLREVWDATKSTRIRKAVASNPNCDSETMRIAARLYIKEVLANPSFELLKIFNEDKFVKKLSDAYEDPQEFCKNQVIGSIKNTNGNRTNLLRAMLTSPNLRGWKILQDITGWLTAAEFNREMRDVAVRNNVVRIAKSYAGNFELSCLLFLHSNGIIDTVSLDQALDSSGKQRGRMTSKGAYVGFISKFVDNAIAGSAFHYELLFKFMIANSAMNIRDITKEIRKEKKFETDGHLKLFAQLYRDVLHYDMICCHVKIQLDKKRHQWYRGWSRPNSDNHSYYLAELIWLMIRARHVEGIPLPSVDIEVLYADIRKVGFDKDYGPFSPDIKFKKINVLTGMNQMCDKLLAIQDDQAFTFYVTSGIIWQEWYAKSGGGSPESKAVDRINRLNEERFANGEKLLYQRSNLDVFPTLNVVEFQCGLDCDPSVYVADCNKPVSLPQPTGIIPREKFAKVVKSLFDLSGEESEELLKGISKS